MAIIGLPAPGNLRFCGTINRMHDITEGSLLWTEPMMQLKGNEPAVSAERSGMIFQSFN